MIGRRIRIGILVLLGGMILPDGGEAASVDDPTESDRSVYAGAEGSSLQVVIGTRVAPPFVVESPDGSYDGLVIQLWDQIARELEIDYRFEERDIEGLLEGVEDGSLFASAAALTVTSEREERVDFTHPFMVTGLGIAVADRPAGLGRAILAFLDPEFLWVLVLLLALLLFWGVLVWLFERKENQEEFGGSRAEGIGSGFWWAAVTMTTVGYGDKAPRTTGGRVIGFAWMFTAVIVISFFTASIASSLTVTQLDTRVGGPDDLPQVRVGALVDSAPLAHLEAEGVRPGPYGSIEEGLQALEEDRIDAFVHDAPILRYFAQEAFRNRVRVLPGTFVEQYYGFALPPGHADRNRINQILLDYIVSDEWAWLNERYLGGG